MDQKLLLLINRAWTHPGLDRLMSALSSFDCWVPILVVVAIWLLWRGGFHGRMFLVLAGVLVGIDDGVISNSLKHFVNRPRPAQVMDDVRQVDLRKARPRLLAVFKAPKVRQAPASGAESGGRSFPSSHTANSTVLAVLAVFFFRRGWMALLLALGVAYSRIYTGSHWPSDVAASLFLGAGVALLGMAVAEAAWRRFGPRFVARVYRLHPSLLPA